MIRQSRSVTSSTANFRVPILCVTGNISDEATLPFGSISGEAMRGMSPRVRVTAPVKMQKLETGRFVCVIL